MIGRPATGTSGLGRLLVSGRRREPSPPAITTAFTSPTQYDLNSVVEELKQFAYDLLWTWQPRIEALFRTLDPEIWKSTRENPVLLLAQLGEEGVQRAWIVVDAGVAIANSLESIGHGLQREIRRVARFDFTPGQWG